METPQSRRHGFTLIELLVVLVILGVLVGLAVPGFVQARRAASTAVAANTLGQLSSASALYLADHNNVFWKYRDDATYAPDTQYWFGYETAASKTQPEGQRYLEKDKGPLGPFLVDAAGLNTDPWFSSGFKPKFKNGHFAFGYNNLLEGRNVLTIERPGECVVFATCAQVNTFQKPASRKNPMIEEFYLINDREYTVHFRVQGRAMVAFANGSVGLLPPSSTMDPRMPEAKIGRFAPVGDTTYLQ